MTVNPVSYMQSGAGVVVGANGAGSGTYGVSLANGTFGALHAYTEAGMDAPVPGAGFYSNAGTYAVANIGYVDGFTVTTAQTVRVTSSIDGGFTQKSLPLSLLGTTAFAYVDFFLQENSPSGAWGQYGIIINHEPSSFVYKDNPSSNFVTDLWLTPGDYSFRWGMRADANAGVGAGGVYSLSTADLSNTGRLYFDSLTPGATLTFLSGHDTALPRFQSRKLTP